jgi:hypothetical protein
VPDKNGGFQWRTDTATKEALINYSSPELIDRDFVFYPRLTDGDFSGGGYQEVYLQPNKYFDSDLEPHIPGFLELKSAWARTNGVAGPSTPGQTVGWKGDFWYTFGQANGNIYSANGGTTTTPVAASVLSLDTDGDFLYAGLGASLYRSSDGTTWTLVSNTLNGTAVNWWVVQQGTNGYFAYYTVSGTPDAIYKIDLTAAFPVAAGAQPQVPTGANSLTLVDVVPYQTAIAILTNDVQGVGCDVWYHDGSNMTRIVRIDGYNAKGMCVAEGNLYVGAFAVGQLNSPELIQITNGSIAVVAKPGSPFPVANQSCGQPRASSNFVYWPLFNPSINGISTAKLLVIQYNLQTGAVAHLPNFASTDGNNANTNGLRRLGVLGDNVAFTQVITGGLGAMLQYQTWAFSGLTYSASGWLASSHIDFQTPSMFKRFKRIEVHHAPLNAGEQILVKAFVDQDPLTFTTSLAPVPAAATATNSTVGSTITAMTFGGDTIGKTLYFALKLTAGTSQLTTPRVSYVSIELGGTWVAELNLACTARRQMLTGEADDQGASGADLAYLLMQAQESGSNLTLYHPNGQTYTMAIESLSAWNPSPHKPQDNQRPLDEEYIVHAILRQAA